MSLSSKLCASAAVALLLSISSTALRAQTGAARQSSGVAPSLAAPERSWLYTESYRCDLTRIATADSIFTRVFEPVLDSLRAEGKILGWSYQMRLFGDEWFRVLSFRFAERDSLFALRGEIISRANRIEPGFFSRFFSVCNDHRENLYRMYGRP
jgi:hypothetical protein